MPLFVVNLLIFALTVLACLSLYQALSAPRGELGDRLSAVESAEVRYSLKERVSAMILRGAGRQSDSRPRTISQQRLNRTLSYAGFRGIPAIAIFQFLRAALMFGFAVVSVTFTAALGKSLLGGAAVGCLLGYALPTFVVQRMARARQRRLLKELPDILSLMVVSLEAGIGIGEVIKLVGIETERQGRAMGGEMSFTAAQMEAGRGLEDSLKDLGERTGVDEIKSLVALIIQSERVGASLAPALRASADLLNSRRRLAAEEAAHKIAVQMLFPLVFLILPAMMLVVLGPAVLQIMKMFGWAR
jgi:tight adherence protein C